MYNDYKHFIQSKTFWAAVLASGIEILQAFEKLPFVTENQAHSIAIALTIFIAINRAFKK